MTPRREWSDANRKRRGSCRGCGKKEAALKRDGRTLELAHVSGREYDPILICGSCGGKGKVQHATCGVCKGEGELRYVRPESVVELCGPATQHGTCHWALDGYGGKDFVPILTPAEAGCMVTDLGWVQAERRITGTGKGLAAA